MSQWLGERVNRRKLLSDPTNFELTSPLGKSAPRGFVARENSHSLFSSTRARCISPGTTGVVRKRWFGDLGRIPVFGAAEESLMSFVWCKLGMIDGKSLDR